ncbi:hypothetical protein ACTFIZ_002773 [Dictyostelium cf. discoideum]
MLKTKTLLFTIILLIFTLFGVSKSSNNYLYSVTLNPNYQLVRVFDVAKNSEICIAQLVIEYQFQSIINIDQDQVIFLGTSGSKEAMIQFNIRTRYVKILSEIDNGVVIEIKENTQPPVFTDKTAISVGLIDDDTFPSIVEWSFSNNNITNSALNLLYYNDATYIAPPMYTYSQSKDTMYVLYQTNRHPIQNGSIAVFQRSNVRNVDFSYNIQGLPFNDTLMIFINPQGKLFAVTSYDYARIGICEINLQKSVCEIVGIVPVGFEYLGQGYNPAFLSFDGTKLILIGNVETSQTPFFVLDTIHWTKSMFALPFTWNDETLNSYTFFNYF